MEHEQKIIEVNPFRCRMWALHDRLEEYVNEDSCKAEIDSFRKHGQMVPVLGRQLRGDDYFDVELVYGARRLFVAKHLNQPLRVEVRPLTDLEAIVAMEIENRHRKDISAYERGLSYARLLRSNHFKSQDEMAHALRVSPSQVCRLLKIIRLPAVIVDAFGEPLQICEGWGLELVDAWDGPNRAALARVARGISAIHPRPAPREVYAELISAGLSGKRRRPAPRDEVVFDDSGKPLFRIRKNAKSIVVVLPHLANPAVMERIRKAISDSLQHVSRTVEIPRYSVRPGVPAAAVSQVAAQHSCPTGEAA